MNQDAAMMLSPNAQPITSERRTRPDAFPVSRSVAHWKIPGISPPGAPPNSPATSQSSNPNTSNSESASFDCMNNETVLKAIPDPMTIPRAVEPIQTTALLGECRNTNPWSTPTMRPAIAAGIGQMLQRRADGKADDCIAENTAHPATHPIAHPSVERTVQLNRENSGIGRTGRLMSSLDIAKGSMVRPTLIHDNGPANGCEMSGRGSVPHLISLTPQPTSSLAFAAASPVRSSEWLGRNELWGHDI